MNKSDWINIIRMHWYLYIKRGSAFEASVLGQPMGSFALDKLDDLLEKHELIKYCLDGEKWGALDSRTSHGA